MIIVVSDVVGIEQVGARIVGVGGTVSGTVSGMLGVVVVVVIACLIIRLGRHSRCFNASALRHPPSEMSLLDTPVPVQGEEEKG